MIPEELPVESVKDWVSGAVSRVGEWWATWGGLLVAVGIVVAAGVAVVEVRRRMRAWRERRTLALVPASQFDPQREDVVRFAGQLAGMRRASSRWVPVPARTVRVTMTSVGEGQMAYLLSGPPALEELLRRRPYAQVDLASPSSDGVVGPLGGAGAKPGGNAAAVVDEAEGEGADDAESLGDVVTAPEPSGGAAGERRLRGTPDPVSDEWMAVEHTEGEAGRGDDWVAEHPEELVAQGRWSVLEEEW